MPVDAARLHSHLVRLTLTAAALLAVLGLALATVGVPAYATPDTGEATRLEAGPLPMAVLVALFAAAQALAVHRGRLGLAWVSTAGVVAFAWGVYPSGGHLLAPLVGANVLLLVGTHTLDRALLR